MYSTIRNSASSQLRNCETAMGKDSTVEAGTFEKRCAVGMSSMLIRNMSIPKSLGTESPVRNASTVPNNS